MPDIFHMHTDLVCASCFQMKFGQRIFFSCRQPFINLMEMGVYKGIIVQKAFRMGYIGVEETIHMLNGDAVEKNIDSGCELVTPENMYNSDIERLIFPFS